MDTNVFISGLKPDDPYHSDAKSIFRGLEQSEIQAETSVLTLLEIASVSGRLFKSRRGTTERERKTFVIRILGRLAGLKTKFINIEGDSPMAVRNIQTRLPNIFNEAILLSLECPLRSLDLIHLAAARHAKWVNDELGAFVTGDTEFLSNKKELFEIIGIPFISPKEYVEGLGL